MEIILNSLSIVSSVITVSAIWGLNQSSPFYIKILLSAGVGIFICIIHLIYIRYNSIVPKDYAVNNDTRDVSSIIVKRHKSLQIDTVVSIYRKNRNVIHMVALGTVVDIPDNMLQIDIFLYNNKDLMNDIKSNQTNIKQYYIVPYIKYIDIQDKLK